MSHRKKSLPPAGEVLTAVVNSLDDDKAVDIVVIDLNGKSSIADHMVIASGRSQRQVSAMAEHLVAKCKTLGLGTIAPEGASRGDWVLLDAGDVIVHLFRPEIRSFYNLEKMWGMTMPEPERAVAVG